MARLLARLVRWSLPVALIVATLVAAAGLGGTLFTTPSEPAPAPAVALNLSNPPALPAADDGTSLTPQGLTVPTCPEPPQPRCSEDGGPRVRTDWCCP